MTRRKYDPLWAVTEYQFQKKVIDFAMLTGWRVHHSRPAWVRSGKMVTAIMGHAGFPDLVLARNGELIIAELKRMGEKPKPMQVLWGNALGEFYRLWYPNDWDEIERTLK